MGRFRARVRADREWSWPTAGVVDMRIPRARCLLSRMDGGSLIGSLIQNDDGGLGWAASSEAIEPLVQLSPAFPQPVTFFANCAATNNGDGRSSGHRESGLGLCLKVEPPGRFWCAPPVHRHRDDATQRRSTSLAPERSVTV